MDRFLLAMSAVVTLRSPSGLSSCARLPACHLLPHIPRTFIVSVDLLMDFSELWCVGMGNSAPLQGPCGLKWWEHICADAQLVCRVLIFYKLCGVCAVMPLGCVSLPGREVGGTLRAQLNTMGGFSYKE